MHNKLAVARILFGKASEMFAPLLLGYEIGDQISNMNNEEKAIVKYIEHPIVEKVESNNLKEYFIYIIITGVIIAFIKLGLAIYEICKEKKSERNHFELEEI